jgi:hypothetical protein
MDPFITMLLTSLGTAGIGALTGNKGEKSSAFDKQQQGGIHDILNSINGMRGEAQDITQNQGYQQGQNWLNDLFNDENFFQNFEAPIQRQFSEQTIPELANRFGSMGSGGSLGSTAFRNQANREAGNLSSNIAALRGGMQQQGVNQSLQYAQQPFQNLMQMYQQALGQPINNQYQGPSAGIGALAAPFAQGASSYWGGQGGNQNYGQGASTQQNWQ